MKAVAIIPARFAATRLPGKVLLDLAGKPMIQHVYERTRAAHGIADVIVATDDERIAQAVHAFGGKVAMTSPAHQTGTDRLAEVAQGLDCDLVVNVQGDEPLIAAQSVQIALAPMLERPDLPMSTLREALTDRDAIADPNNVKVVVDHEGFALYFSRHPIPFRRNADQHITWWRHIGLYVYRRDFLLTYARLAPTPLQVAESLEQLRALEHGYRIFCAETPHPAIGVDTPEDLERVRALLAQ